MPQDNAQAPVRTTLQDLLRQKQVWVSPSDEAPSLSQANPERLKALLFTTAVEALKENQPCCAKRLFNVLLSIDPDHMKAKLNLSVALSQLGDQGGAAKILEEVLQKYPENRIAKQNLTILRQL